MPKVWPEIGQLVIGPTEEEPRTWIGRGGEEVPDWALAIASSPRSIDFDSEEQTATSVFPSTFPATF